MNKLQIINITTKTIMLCNDTYNTNNTIQYIQYKEYNKMYFNVNNLVICNKTPCMLKLS